MPAERVPASSTSSGSPLRTLAESSAPERSTHSATRSCPAALAGHAQDAVAELEQLGQLAVEGDCRWSWGGRVARGRVLRQGIERTVFFSGLLPAAGRWSCCAEDAAVPSLDDRQLYVSLFAVALAIWCAGLLVLRRDGALGKQAVTCALCVAAAAAMASWDRFGAVPQRVGRCPGRLPVGPGPGEGRAAPADAHVRVLPLLHRCEVLPGARLRRALRLYGARRRRDRGGRSRAARASPAGCATSTTSSATRRTSRRAQHCTEDIRPHFSTARWDSFKNDIRELRRLVGDGFWPGVVGDAGFNPPPSWCVFGSAVANAIPIRAAGMADVPRGDGHRRAPARRVLRRAETSVRPARRRDVRRVRRGVVHRQLRLERRRVPPLHVADDARPRPLRPAAGALGAGRRAHGGFGVRPHVSCRVRDRRARSRSPTGRFIRRTNAGGSCASARASARRRLVLVSLGTIVFGVESWRVFFMRIVRHGDVYYGMHIGLKKVITWREWVPRVNFAGHQGLGVFHDWNLRLRATWVSMRWLVDPGAARRRRRRRLRRRAEAPVRVGDAHGDRLRCSSSTFRRTTTTS